MHVTFVRISFSGPGKFQLFCYFLGWKLRARDCSSNYFSLQFLYSEKLSTFDSRGQTIEMETINLERLMRQIERDNCVLHTKLAQIRELEKLKK